MQKLNGMSAILIVSYQSHQDKQYVGFNRMPNVNKL